MKTIEISDEAFDYLKSRAIPLQDTTVTVFDRIMDEIKALSGNGANPSTGQDETPVNMAFGVGNLPNVSFTTIDSATINGKSVKKCYWNDILEETIAVAVHSGATPEKIKDLLFAQICEGQKTTNGYRYVAKAGFSFQGVDAVRACKNIAALAKAFGIAVSIKLRWQTNPKAQFAGQVGHLVLP